MSRILTAACIVAALAAMSLTARAQEFYVGDAVTKNDLELVPHYLLGIEMAPMTKDMAMGPNAVHIEIDVHATKGEKHGFKAGEWIPYLTISYTLEKVGTSFKKSGKLLAMTAADGPHYANNVAIAGDGDYRRAAVEGGLRQARRQGHRSAGLVAAILANLDISFPQQEGGQLTIPASRAGLSPAICSCRANVRPAAARRAAIRRACGCRLSGRAPPRDR